MLNAAGIQTDPSVKNDILRKLITATEPASLAVLSVAVAGLCFGRRRGVAA